MHIFDTRELFADLRDAQLMLKTIRLSMCNVLVRQTDRQTDRQTETDRGDSFSSQRFRCAALNCTNNFDAQIKI